MAITSFKPISFSKGPLLAGKLNTLAENVMFLYERMMQVYYKAGGVSKSNGVKIIAGTSYVPSNGWNVAGQDISFGTVFTPGCRPVIVLGVNTTPKGRIYAVSRNIDHTTAAPDHRGFQVRVYADELDSSTNKLTNGVYVNYIAVGW